MNRILVYTVIAILLGTVTMVAPLALLGTIEPIGEGGNTVTSIESEGGTLERNDMLTVPESPEAAPEPSETLSGEPELCDAKLNETDAVSGLSSIGLMIVPSFLIALGAFVYLKKRIE
jgi:hypothetical protein